MYMGLACIPSQAHAGPVRMRWTTSCTQAQEPIALLSLLLLHLTPSMCIVLLWVHCSQPPSPTPALDFPALNQTYLSYSISAQRAL